MGYEDSIGSSSKIVKLFEANPPLQFSQFYDRVHFIPPPTGYGIKYDPRSSVQSQEGWVGRTVYHSSLHTLADAVNRCYSDDISLPDGEERKRGACRCRLINKKFSNGSIILRDIWEEFAR